MRKTTTKKSSTAQGSLQKDLMAGYIILAVGLGLLLGLIVIQVYSEARLQARVDAAIAAAREISADMAMMGPAERLAYEPNLKNRKIFKGFMFMNSRGYLGRIDAPQGEDTRVAERSLRLSMTGGEKITLRQQPFFSREPHQLDIILPVIDQKIVVGAIWVPAELPGFYQFNPTVVLWILAVFFGNILILTLFTRYYLNKRLIQPIGLLADDLKLLAENQFDPDRERPHFSTEMEELFKRFEDSAWELITGRLQLEESLKEIKMAQTRLIKSEKMASLGQLSMGLAHELGNPIGAVMGFVHLLKMDGISEEDRAEFLKRCEHELGRMDGIIKKLLGFARPGGALAGPVEISEVAQTVAALAKPQPWAADLTIEVNLPEGLPMALAERNAILQVLINLVSNAGQAMATAGPQAPKIVITAGSDCPGEVWVKVADNGPGVAAADVGRLFEPYYTSKAVGQGTGLGLAISGSIIDGFGGRLEFVPAKEGGAVFMFTLPAAE